MRRVAVGTLAVWLALCLAPRVPRLSLADATGAAGPDASPPDLTLPRMLPALSPTPKNPDGDVATDFWASQPHRRLGGTH